MEALRERLRAAADPEKAVFLARYFKTGPGQYAEGDLFIGVTVPNVRKIAREFRDLSSRDAAALLRSRIHEERLLALLILVSRFERGDEEERFRIFSLYRKGFRYVNNWDLVDLSAPKILGAFLLDKPRDLLFTLARSEKLWERRSAIVSTYAFIRRGELEPTLEISKMLLEDREDLIHKATGWMLREAGKRDRATLERFLDAHLHHLARTTLRYAIERFSPEERERYLSRPVPGRDRSKGR